MATRRRNVAIGFQPVFFIRTISDAFQVFAVFRFVGENQASLDGVNAYRLEAYATLLFGAASDGSRSCGKTITAAQRDDAAA